MVDQTRWDLLESIGHGVAADGRFLAVLGTGSCGPEYARLDQWSDLDFFVVVKPEFATEAQSSLSWLEAAAVPLWRFRYLPDAWKVLFDGDVFAEFGIVTTEHLATILYAPARIVWAATEFDRSLATSRVSFPAAPAKSTEYWLNEAACQLFVALGRYLRGEILAAWERLHVEVLGAVVELLRRDSTSTRGDPFSPRRRFEFLYPGVGPVVSAAFGSWNDFVAVAMQVLSALESLGEIDPAVSAAIRRLAVVEPITPR